MIEAAAMERPIITTDVPGCRDVVDHGVWSVGAPVQCPFGDVRDSFAVKILLGSAFRKGSCRVVAEFQVAMVNYFAPVSKTDDYSVIRNSFFKGVE